MGDLSGSPSVLHAYGIFQTQTNLFHMHHENYSPFDVSVVVGSINLQDNLCA
jgi:hypothetical protein